MISHIDLHVHTTESDGRWTPARVVEQAAARGVRVLALTDHDTTSGCAEAEAQAQATGVKVIAGVEINAEWPTGEAHVLGYFAQPGHAELQTALGELRVRRRQRAQAIVSRLNETGVPLSMEQVQAQSGVAAIGRLHIARALVAGQWANTPQDAFDLYLGVGRPAFVPRYALTPQQAIALVRKAGGVASLAHPVRSGCEAHVAALVDAGLNALEVYYFDHSAEDVARLSAVAERWGLLRTGGSDFHLWRKDGRRGIGSVWVPEADAERLLAVLGL